MINDGDLFLKSSVFIRYECTMFLINFFFFLIFPLFIRISTVNFFQVCDFLASDYVMTHDKIDYN